MQLIFKGIIAFCFARDSFVVEVVGVLVSGLFLLGFPFTSLLHELALLNSISYLLRYSIHATFGGFLLCVNFSLAGVEGLSLP